MGGQLREVLLYLFLFMVQLLPNVIFHLQTCAFLTYICIFVLDYQLCNLINVIMQRLVAAFIDNNSNKMLYEAHFLVAAQCAFHSSINTIQYNAIRYTIYQHLNFDGNHPLEHKRGIVQTLTHRARSIVRDFGERKKEFGLCYQHRPLHKISSHSVHNILSNVVNRQTDRNTNRQKDKQTLLKT